MNATVFFLQQRSLFLSPLLTKPLYSQRDSLKFISSFFSHFVSSVMNSNNELLHFHFSKCEFSKSLQTSIVINSLYYNYSTKVLASSSTIFDTVFIDIRSSLSAGAIKMITESGSLTIQSCNFVNLSCQYETVALFPSNSESRGGYVCLFRGSTITMNSCCYLNKLLTTDWRIHAITSICSNKHQINGFGFVNEGVKISGLIELFHNNVVYSNLNFTNVNYGVYCSWEPYNIEMNFIQASYSNNPLFLATTATGTSKLTYANFLDSSCTLSFWKSYHLCRYLNFIRCSLTISIHNSATFSFQNSYSDTQIHSQIAVSSGISPHTFTIQPICVYQLKTPYVSPSFTLRFRSTLFILAYILNN